MAKRKSVKTDHQKAEDFKRLAAKRVNTIARNFELLARLANGGKYAHTPEQLKKIQTAISESGDACFAAYSGKKTAATGFSL